MNCDAQLAGMQSGTENVWGTVQGKCLEELSRGWNVQAEMSGEGGVKLSGSPRRNTSLHVQQLWFVPSWVTYTHIQILTGYTISSAAKLKINQIKCKLINCIHVSAFKCTACIQYCIIPYMQNHAIDFLSSLLVFQFTTSCVSNVLFISYAQHFL